MRYRSIVIVVVGFVLGFVVASFLSGCASLPANTQIAKTGGDIVASVNELAKVVVTLPISDDRKAPILIACNRLQTLGPKLADALDAYDKATAANKVGMIDGLNAILNQMTAVVSSLNLPADGTAAKAAQLALAITKTLASIQVQLATVRANAALGYALDAIAEAF